MSRYTLTATTLSAEVSKIQQAIQTWWDNVIDGHEGEILPLPEMGQCYKIQGQQILGSKTLVDSLKSGVSNEWAQRKLRVVTNNIFLSELQRTYKQMAKQVDVGEAIKDARKLHQEANRMFGISRYEEAQAGYETMTSTLSALQALSLSVSQQREVSGLLAISWFNRACCAMKRGSRLQAMVFCQEAIELNPSYKKAKDLHRHLESTMICFPVEDEEESGDQDNDDQKQ